MKGTRRGAAHSPMRVGARLVATATALALLAVVLAPGTLGDVGGSGEVEDIVKLTATANTVTGAALTSASGAPAHGSSTYFEVKNAEGSTVSNVETFIRYAWSGTPYWGASDSQTSITLRGATSAVSDLLWFKQATKAGSDEWVTSEYFSPLELEDGAGISTVTWTSNGDACTEPAWTGTADASFTASAQGTLTFRTHAASGPSDDAPATTDTFHWCLDAGATPKVYFGTSRTFDAPSVLVQRHDTASSAQTLKEYRYEFKSTGQSHGNAYCLTGFTGSGTAAVPSLTQCSLLADTEPTESYARLYPLFDPPSYFPSGNQGGSASGAVSFALAGTQWNPWEPGTTNQA